METSWKHSRTRKVWIMMINYILPGAWQLTEEVKLQSMRSTFRQRGDRLQEHWLSDAVEQDIAIFQCDRLIRSSAWPFHRLFAQTAGVGEANLFLGSMPPIKRTLQNFLFGTGMVSRRIRLVSWSKWSRGCALKFTERKLALVCSSVFSNWWGDLLAGNSGLFSTAITRFNNHFWD